MILSLLILTQVGMICMIVLMNGCFVTLLQCIETLINLHTDVFNVMRLSLMRVSHFQSMNMNM